MIPIAQALVNGIMTGALIAIPAIGFSAIFVPTMATRPWIFCAVSLSDASATPVAIAPSHTTDSATQSSR